MASAEPYANHEFGNQVLRPTRHMSREPQSCLMLLFQKSILSLVLHLLHCFTITDTLYLRTTTVVTTHLENVVGRWQANLQVSESDDIHQETGRSHTDRDDYHDTSTNQSSPYQSHSLRGVGKLPSLHQFLRGLQTVDQLCRSDPVGCGRGDQWIQATSTTLL